ncbi:Hypothetical predicted protein [Octopus vulgaris]|uniref:Uncharacterized protein n=1 Tax=Octopus vulgaris TaxID=6645 RepID=A0AA36APQ0_OCTVU|nr:Hypothetical predicted protein [Octopus vulgaris]
MNDDDDEEEDDEKKYSSVVMAVMLRGGVMERMICDCEFDVDGNVNGDDSDDKDEEDLGDVDAQNHFRTFDLQYH